MHKYLPSKRFTLILISIVIALGIIYSFSLLNKNQKTDPQLLLNAEAKAKVQEFMALDSDSDGLKDWEEALWKTDPQKSDTDNDGTNDANEIKLNRDPLKQNINPSNQEPSDKIDPTIIANEKKIEEEYKNLTVTERISRELFAQYIATKKIGQDLTETDMINILNNTLIDLPEVSFQNHNENELTIIDSSDNETLKKYANNVGKIIITNLKVPTEDIESIINDLSLVESDERIQIEAEKIFQRFTPLIENNKRIIQGLLQTDTPKILVKEHLNTINSFEKIYTDLDLIQKSAKDLVLFAPLLNLHQTNIKELSNSLIELTKKILSLNINYDDQTSYGYQFFNVIMFKK